MANALPSNSPIDAIRPLLLTPLETARLLSLSPRKLWGLTAEERIKPIRIGRCVRYCVNDLEAFIAQQRAAGAGGQQ